MSDVLRAKELSSTTSFRSGDYSVNFNLHSSYYNDFFLLRTTITVNGLPGVIKVVHGNPVLRVCDISAKVSNILQTVAPVITKHGVYQVDNFYYEQVILFLVKFQSKSSLKQFLTEKEAVQKELSSATANCFREETIPEQPAQSSQSPSALEQIRVSVDTTVYLVSPVVGCSPEVHEVDLENHSFMVDKWKRSKVFDLTITMFTKPPPNRSTCKSEYLMSTNEDSLDSAEAISSQPQSPETANAENNDSGSAELSALQLELNQGGVTEWFSLGVQLKIPAHELLVIREDHRTVVKCRLEMLIRWEQLEKPTWTKLVTALDNIGRKDLAVKLAKKYGVSLPANEASHVQVHVKDTEIDKNINESAGSVDETGATGVPISGKSLSLLEDEVEKALQSRDAVSKTLEMDIDTTLPELEMKVSSLNQEVRLLKIKLKNREEENQMLDEANQSLNLKWNEAIQRTRQEKRKAIEMLKEEIKRKEDELAQTKEQLADKEKRLNEKMKELTVKSACVFELQNELEQVRRKLNNQQEQMDQKLIESQALAQSREKYLEEIEIQRNVAVMESTKTREEVQSYSQKLADKEKQIGQLSEKITEQEREMVKLRDELSSCQHISEQLSAEQTRENDKKEQQLHILTMSVMKLQLELHKTKQKKNQDKLNLEEAKKTMEKYDKLLEARGGAEGQSLAGENTTLVKRKNVEEKISLSHHKLQGEIIHTTLPLTLNGLGFRFIGGDRPGEPLQIISITRGSVSDQDGHLKVGDVLLRVNGISVLNYDQRKAVDLFQSIPLLTDVEIEVHRGYSLPGYLPPDIVTVNIVKGPLGFGFSIGKSMLGPIVVNIMDLPRCGQLREDDVLFEVNGENVREYAHNDVVTVLKRCPKGNQASFTVLRQQSQSHVFNVCLIKQEFQSGFGIRIIGGNDEGSQVSIGEIIADGAADLDGRLQSGDEIIHVNGTSVMDVPHHAVVSLINEAAAQGEVVLTIQRKKPMMSAMLPPQGVRYVIIKRPNVQTSFGFVLEFSTFRPNCTICRLVPDSPAEKSGALYMYDELLAVNSNDVSNNIMDYGDIVGLIENSGISVSLTVQQPEDVVRQKMMADQQESPLGHYYYPLEQGDPPAAGHKGENGNRLQDHPNGENDHMPPPVSTSFNEKTLNIQIRHHRNRFGFSIRGGAEVSSPLFVLRIANGEAAAKDGRLKVGDKILEINGYSTEGMLRSDAVKIIKIGGDYVNLIVRRLPEERFIESGSWKHKQI